MRTLFALLVFLSATSLSAQDDGGMKTTAAVEIGGSYAADRDTAATDRFEVREAEIMVYGSVDPMWDGTFSLAAHPEGGESVAEVHEAYLSTSRLIPRSRLRLGQFFLGIGRLNQFHRHEWPVIVAPTVHREFFGDEGVFDAGAEYGVLLPVPFYLDLTMGVTNGFTFGHSHNTGAKPRIPTHYARLATYTDVAGWGMQTAVNALGRTDDVGTAMSLVGLDFTAKKREGKTLVGLLQAEAWQRRLKPKQAKAEEAFGFYVLPQWGFTEEWQIGVMGDYYTITSLKTVTGKKVANARVGWQPTITYRPSEFSHLRLAWRSLADEQDGRKTTRENWVEMQAGFILGAHPAHDF